MADDLDTALFVWEEGHRELARLRSSGSAPAAAERHLERVTEQLRRRIGPTFRSAQLAALYDEGTDWALELAPADPVGWDPRAVADAAFYAYLRGATDYAGGRTRIDDE